MPPCTLGGLGRCPLSSFKSSLIAELLQLQNQSGWLEEEALHALAARRGIPLHVIQGLASFYTHFRRQPPRAVEIEICRDLACQLAGGQAACERLRSALEGNREVAIREVSCLGRCDQAPAASLGEVVIGTAQTHEVMDAVSNGAEPKAHTAGNWADADPYAQPSGRYGALRYREHVPMGERRQKGARATNTALWTNLFPSGSLDALPLWGAFLARILARLGPILGARSEHPFGVQIESPGSRLGLISGVHIGSNFGVPDWVQFRGFRLGPVSGVQIGSSFWGPDEVHFRGSRLGPISGV